MRRAVNSTLGGETQALSDALGALEWLGVLLAEVRFGVYNLANRE